MAFSNRCLIPVRHRGLVIPHTPEEYERYWKGVDREAAEILDGIGDDHCRCSRTYPLSPEALERARRWNEGLR